MAEQALSEHGMTWGEVFDQLIRRRGERIPYQSGQYSFFWRKPIENIWLAAEKAASLYFGETYIGEANLPSQAIFDAEIKAMVAELVNLPAGGHVTLTSGGTESIFFGVKCARELAREQGRAAPGSARRPNIVAPSSVHCAFEKAASYMDLEVRRVAIRDDARADVRAMAEACDEHTILIAGSAPSYPYGLIDPIPELARLSLEKDLWFHVDACVGGFVNPFFRELGVNLPPTDFLVPGVDSMSADLHKFGWAPPGISTFSLRDGSHQRLQRFHFDGRLWQCGDYETDTLAGSRPLAVLVATWTAMKMLGRGGYLEGARRMREQIERLRRGIATIPELVLRWEPESAFVIYGSDELDTYAIANGLNAHGVPTVCYPLMKPGIHLIIDPLETDQEVERYLACVRQVITEVKDGQHQATGQASTYG
ncbi:MAG: aspartate aminotransferase family protein [Gammaproteobacteria bacterium]|nr:MAG: aspartate aminotransferase family protein [Gammaproteobacteria bacterium]